MRTVTITFLTKISSKLSYLLLIALLCSVISACSTNNTAPAPSSQPIEEEYIYHRIKYQGETVAIISAWYTKSSKNWPEIVESNPKMVPSRLRIGDLVRIPKRLVRRFSSLPQDFVSSFKSGVNTDSSKNSSSNASENTVSENSTPENEVSDNANNYNTVEENNERPNRQDSTESSNANDASIVIEHSNTGSKSKDLDDSSFTIEVKNGASKEVEVEVSAPTAAEVPPAPANDENQKIRDQLMQELLQ